MVGTIPYVNLRAQWEGDREELLPIIESVLASGNYVGGEEVELFEKDIASFCDTKHAVALNSGTDALVCALSSVGVGPDDEVITPPNSFIASTAAIVHLGAIPVFADVGEDQNIDPLNIEKIITKKTKAIMPVHLTGRVCDMDAIMEIASYHKIPVIEDSAQSVGSKYNDRLSGSIGEVGCFSAHPLKNLNACGDSGFLTTNSPEIAEKVRLARSHGLSDRNTARFFGHVSRMDCLQAAILRFRLSKINEVIRLRRRNAEIYRNILRSDSVVCPEETQKEFNTWHTFVIQTKKRDQLRKHLVSKNIETSIHYPIPIHLQPACKRFGYSQGDFPVCERQSAQILTLPVHQFLSAEQIATVANEINKFFGS